MKTAQQVFAKIATLQRSFGHMTNEERAKALIVQETLIWVVDDEV